MGNYSQTKVESLGQRLTSGYVLFYFWQKVKATRRCTVVLLVHILLSQLKKKGANSKFRLTSLLLFIKIV